MYNNEDIDEDIDLKERIVVVKMRVFYIKSAVKNCKYCDIFLKSKSFAELKNFGRYIPGVKFIYEELKCEWQGLNRPRFTDQEVRESNKKLSWDLDEYTRNYLISRWYVKNYPAIVLIIGYNTLRVKIKIINGINIMHKENDMIVFEFLNYILNYLKDIVDPKMKEKFTHDKARLSFIQAEPTLMYEDKFDINI
ncbi:MAG: hypothetical protein ACP6IY_20625 [Promethearchaeia archaeon]